YESSYLAIHPSQKFLYSETKGGNAIRVFPINQLDGALTPVSVWLLGYSPDLEIAIHPDGKFLFGSSFTPLGRVYDELINADGSLSTLSVPLSSDSSLSAPKSFAIKATGDYMFVADYNNNCVKIFSIDQGTGYLGFPTTMGTDTNPMAVATHPMLNYLYVASVWWSRIQSYSINPSTGGLTVTGTPVGTGSGPNFLVIDPTGNFLYCVNRTYPSTISGYRISQSDGTLTSLPGSPYAVTNSTTVAKVLEHIAIDPTGKYLYAPVSGAGSVEGYSIDPSTGVLTHLLPLTGWSNPGTLATNPVVAAIAQ
ncbi:MAG TPA: beta-propeller fold lactonase family protein, partial [Spirochaetota bacterium]